MPSGIIIKKQGPNSDMAIEIERKFLLANDSWKQQAAAPSRYQQGYMTLDGEKNSVRVRLCDDKAWVNFKSATLGMRRLEFEYPVPVDDARQMLDNLCYSPQIEKDRYLVKYDNHTWEVDVFYGENDGLVVAEIELQSEDEQFKHPEWLGEEVTDDERYYNVCLIRNPYKNW